MAITSTEAGEPVALNLVDYAEMLTRSEELRRHFCAGPDLGLLWAAFEAPTATSRDGERVHATLLEQVAAMAVRLLVASPCVRDDLTALASAETFVRRNGGDWAPCPDDEGTWVALAGRVRSGVDGRLEVIQWIAGRVYPPLECPVMGD